MKYTGNIKFVRAGYAYPHEIFSCFITGVEGYYFRGARRVKDNVMFWDLIATEGYPPIFDRDGIFRDLHTKGEDELFQLSCTLNTPIDITLLAKLQQLMIVRFENKQMSDTYFEIDID